MTAQSDELRRLISLVQIEDVRLIEASCQTTISGEQVRLSELSITPGVGLSSTLGPDRTFRIRARMEARVTPKEQETDSQQQPVMSFRAIHELRYSVLGTHHFADETLREFGRVNAVFNVWPYWRTFIQHATADMGLPRLILPVFRGGLAEVQKTDDAQGLKSKPKVLTARSVTSQSKGNPQLPKTSPRRAGTRPSGRKRNVAARKARR
jgi:hypothetical protein